MKIIIGSESFLPNISGVAVSTENLALNLAKCGHKIFVFCPSKSFQTHYDSNSKAYKIFRLRSIPNPFRKGFRFGFLSSRQIIREVERIKPDIIHLQDPTSICSILLSAAKKNKIPVVIHNHFSLDYVITYFRFLGPLKAIIGIVARNYLVRFYNACQFVICPTETVKKELVSWGIKKPIVAISNGVDIERFFAYENLDSLYLKYHLPKNPLVLYLGRIDKDKFIDVLIKAMPYVHKTLNAHFVIAGSGDELGKMRTLSEKLGLNNRGSFLGWINHSSKDLEMLYQAARVFVVPCPYETQSIVTMEAMAAGLPIVGVNSGALPELVKQNRNGLLVRTGDSRALGEAISKILEDEKLRKKMSKASLEIVSSHQVKASLQKILKIYEKVLEKSKS